MLGLLAMGLQLMGTVCAASVPIVVLYWLLTLINQPFTQVLTVPVGRFLAPFIAQAHRLIQLPPVSVNRHPVDMQPLELMLYLTAAFMGLVFTSKLVSVLNKRLLAKQQTLVMQFHQQASQSQFLIEQKQLVRQSQLLIVLHFTFGNNLSLLEHFKDYAQAEGWLYDEILSPETTEIRDALQTQQWVLVFNDPKRGLDYCQKACESLLGYYQTLRPMDEKPPFKAVAHTVAMGSQAVKRGIEKAESLFRYAKPNQVLASQALSIYLASPAHGQDLMGRFKLASLGLYEVERGQPEEIYDLPVSLPQYKI